MRKAIILPILLFLISCNQNPPEIEKIKFETDYKFSSEIENEILRDTVTNPHFTGFKYQMAASDYATKGVYTNALINWDLAMGTTDKSYTQKQVDSINGIYKKVLAEEYILQKAKDYQILIINEAHHNSRHRFFTKSLLKGLFDNGYRNLGLEALTNGKDKDTLLNNRGYPVQGSGFYIKDPQFGDLVRVALDIGYNVFPYEATNGSDGKEREIEQAKNIQKVIEERPNEKFLIYCGYDHVLEGNHKSWGKAMAGRLSEYTGINPLTINQVAFSEKSRPEYNNPLLKALEIKRPTVLLDQQNNPYKYQRGESWTDMAVFYPNTKYRNGRPNWLFENGVKSVPTELEDLDISFPVLILAYKKGENIIDGIPLDIVEVKDKADKINLALKRGDYQIVIINRKGDARKLNLKVN